MEYHAFRKFSCRTNGEKKQLAMRADCAQRFSMTSQSPQRKPHSTERSDDAGRSVGVTLHNIDNNEGCNQDAVN